LLRELERERCEYKREERDDERGWGWIMEKRLEDGVGQGKARNRG
jgi:hypothetical protein